MLHVRTESSEASHHRLTRCWIQTELSRKLQQFYRFVERYRRLRHGRKQRRTFRFLLAAFLRILTELDVRPEPAVNHIHVLSCDRIHPKQSRPFRLRSKQGHRFLDVEVCGSRSRRQRRGVSWPARAELQEWTVATDAH